MKKFFLPIIFIAFLISYLPVSGQYLAIKGGLNLSTQLSEDNTSKTSDDYASKTGFHAGLLAGMGFGPVAVEGSVLFSSKGYAAEIDNSTGITYRENINPLYLEVPIDLKLRLGLGNAKLYASVGPVFGYGILGKIHTETLLNGEIIESNDEKIKWGTSSTDHLKPFDFGVGVGAGIDIGTLMLGFKYTFGMNNLSPVTSNGEVIKNQCMQFSLGFRILDL